MKITGKAGVDFYSWLLNEGNEIIKNGSIEYDFYYMCKYMLPENMVCAKIVEWLDTVGLHISVEPHIGGGADVYYAKVIYMMENFIDTWCNIENKEYQPSVFYFDNRHEATKQAINKAIEIYNNR